MTVPKPAPFKRAADVKPHYAKGDIWMIHADPLNPPIGNETWSNRPGLIVSTDQINNSSGCVSVVYLTSSTVKRSSPMNVVVPSHADGKTSLALCGQIHTVDHSRISKRLVSVPRHVMKEVDAAIAFSLSMDKDPNTNQLVKRWESYLKSSKMDLRKEIEALSAKTTDQRVESLKKALSLITAERDALSQLIESRDSRPAAMEELSRALKDAL